MRRFASYALAAWLAKPVAALTQAAQAAAEPAADHRLSAGGWTFMLLSAAFVWGLTLWCFRRVLTTKDEEFVEPPASLGA
jgi:hypothetical protein